MKRFLMLLLAGSMISVLSVFSVNAADYDFSGTFLQDNEIQLLMFTVGEVSDVTVFSSSWDDGGFDPILAIWTSEGNLIQQQDDGGNIGNTLSNGVSYDHGLWDSYYNVTLNQGTYIATIGQYDNFAISTNLADGFSYDGNPNFTQGYGLQENFNCVDGTGRNGNWAFHLLNVEEASQVNPVPEPATLILLGSGLLGFIGRKKVLKK